MEYFTELGHIGLFLSAFLAATVLPLSSEVVLVALLLNGMSPASLVAVATLGNVLGALVNFALGYWAGVAVIRRWLRMSEAEFLSAETRFRKYGVWSLCLAWAPIIGDPLTVVAGVLRVRLLWFVLLVTVGKFLRYVVVAWMAG
ncbi:YqaA family protein [Alcanivorax sp. DP30]|uniref:YqaA family protein n=1 Tax=Alcanivorax sp. DP30 TaxID=2606217 RepID=UPI001367AF7D|nr:YqaA family protein [Alcanivorax sp. DP30]MZR62803.1 DedA family protein [Alcanivorax sp. DP30]